MNFKQLQYFVATAKHGSITAAARELDVAQPSISQQLANLEYELKNALFERNYKGVQLTESGQLFYTHATDLLNRMINAKAVLTDLAKYPTGTVSLGLTQSIGNVLAIPLIDSLCELYPDIKVQITTLPSKILNRALTDKEIDISLSYREDRPTANILSKPLLQENLYLAVGTRGSCSTFRDLLALDALTFDTMCNVEILTPGHKESLFDVLKAMEDRHQKKLKLKAGFGQLSTALRVVAEGKGIMIAPSSAACHLTEQGLIKLIPLLGHEFKRDVTISTHVDSTITKAMSLVIESVVALTKEANDNGSWTGRFLYTEQDNDVPQPKASINYLAAFK